MGCVQCSRLVGGHMCKPVSVTPTALFESLRALRVAEPNLGVKPLIAQLQKQQPDLGACTKEVREALKALKKESEAKVATAAPGTADVAPSPVALSLTCIGCARLPSDIDDETEKHPICDKSRDQQLSQAEAWQLHGTFHSKALKENQKASADGGVHQQRKREVAQRVARDAALSGDKHDELLAEGTRHASQQDYPRAAEDAAATSPALHPPATIAPSASKFRADAKEWSPNSDAKAHPPPLPPPTAYYNLGVALSNSGYKVKATQCFLQAKEREPVGSERWAKATAEAFHKLTKKECGEVAVPEWWNDEGLKALSVRVVRALPNDNGAHDMRGLVLSGQSGAWEVGSRSAVELTEAAACFERSAELTHAPAVKTQISGLADWCRSEAEAVCNHTRNRVRRYM